MQKKADSHSLDPRKITISHLYALQEQKKIEEFMSFHVLFKFVSAQFMNE